MNPLEPWTREERAEIQRRLREQEAEKTRRRLEDKSAHAELVRQAEAGDKGAMLCLFYQSRPVRTLTRLRDGTYTYDRDVAAREREL